MEDRFGIKGITGTCMGKLGRNLPYFFLLCSNKRKMREDEVWSDMVGSGTVLVGVDEG